MLNYLRELSTDSPHGVIAGQFVSGPGWPNAYNLFVKGLYQKTGQWPGLVGSDDFVQKPSKALLPTPPVPTSAQIDALTRNFLDQWGAGGLVTFTWLIDNPWHRLGTGEFCKNVPSPCVPGALADLTRDDNPAGRYFKAEMDSTAGILEKLQAAGMIVIFRPFPEQNGSWFWWGAQTEGSPTQAEFSALWRFTHHYFTETKKLKNLLWVFAPSSSEKGLKLFPTSYGVIQPAPHYYPGDQYVDLTGLSYYDNKISLPTYPEMIALGKPFGLTEYGPLRPASGKNFDFDAKIHKMLTLYPRIAFFMAWQDGAPTNYFALVSNAKPSTLMSDPLIITRERLDLKKRLAKDRSKPAP